MRSMDKIRKGATTFEVFEKSSLTLALDSDKHVVASELTKFSLETFGAAGKDSRRIIHLEKGTISNQIDNKLLLSESYVVEGPNASMSIRGTVFTVNVFFDNAGLCHTAVEVKEGTVELTDKGTGKVKTLNEGQRANVISRSEREPDGIPTTSSDIKPVGGESGGNGTYSSVSDVEYRKSSLGGIEILKYIGKEKIVNIPAEIDGKKVDKIGNGVFMRSEVTSVSIPDSVTKIERGAFSGCKATIIYKGKTYTKDNYSELYTE